MSNNNSEMTDEDYRNIGVLILVVVVACYFFWPSGDSTADTEKVEVAEKVEDEALRDIPVIGSVLDLKDSLVELKKRTDVVFSGMADYVAKTKKDFSDSIKDFNPVDNDMWDRHAAWVAAQEYVQRNLRYRDASFGWAQQSVEDTVTVKGSQCFGVRGWVDAKNGFGAVKRINFSCDIKIKNKHGDWEGNNIRFWE